MENLYFTDFEEDLNEEFLWKEEDEDEVEAELAQEETDLYRFVETLHHHLMEGKELTRWQQEELGRLLLLQNMTASEIGRAKSLGEPPESVLGMAAAKVMAKLPEKIGPVPLANGRQGWLNKPVLIGPPRPTATNSRHIRNYFHACIDSILKDEYDKKLNFLGLPDTRQAKRLGICAKPEPEPGSTWSVGGSSILPLEAISGTAPSPEDLLCTDGCSDAFRTLAGLNHKAEFILFYLYRQLGFPPRDQILLFSRLSPAMALRYANDVLHQCCSFLHPDWMLSLKDRLPNHWTVPLSADTISTGISRVKKSVEKQQVHWCVVA